MPILVFVILVILIAQLGFWDTLAAVLGAGVMFILLVLLAAALLVLVGMLLMRRMRG
jgi:hypothetical protein